MTPSTLPSDRTAPLGFIAPASHASGNEVSTPWIKFDKYQAAKIVLMTGTLGAAATVDLKIEQATSEAGADAKDITGKAITTIEKATGDNKLAVIDLRPAHLDVGNEFTCFRVTAQAGVADSIFSVLVEGYDPRYAPARDHASADVLQTVT